MECLFIFMLCCGWQKIINPSVTAALQTASSGSVFSCENIFPFGLAGVAGLALRSNLVAHSRLWRYAHANSLVSKHGEKFRLMPGRNNNDPMAMDAVGFSIMGRDSL